MAKVTAMLSLATVLEKRRVLKGESKNKVERQTTAFFSFFLPCAFSAASGSPAHADRSLNSKKFFRLER